MFLKLYNSTYAEHFNNTKKVYTFTSFLTSVFAIVAGGVLLVKIIKNRTGFVSYIVVACQLTEALVLLICTVLGSSAHWWERSANEVLTLGLIGFSS